MKQWNVKIHGIVVDCVIYKSVRETDAKVRSLIDGENPVGARYDIKGAFQVPCCPQAKPKPGPPRYVRPPDWTVIEETDTGTIDKHLAPHMLGAVLGNVMRSDTIPCIQQFVGHDSPLGRMDMTTTEKLAVIAANNNGALVTGPAGTGKTLFQKELTRSLMAFDRSAKIKCAAYTNAASRLMPAGKTLQHLRLRLAKRAPQRLVLIIDEVSMVPLSLGTELSRLTRLGTRFYLIGDFDGQELPIFDDGWGMRGMGGDPDGPVPRGQPAHRPLGEPSMQ